MKNLASRSRLLPDRPGIYIFKNSDGRPIYVGKAKSLKKRVASYFVKHADSPKTASMLENAYDIEIIATASEHEALILENNFIKKHRPRYNIVLRDDKEYPYIKITTTEKWPRIFLVRKIEADGAEYFGPYSGSTVKETIQLIKRLFPVRLCRETPLKMRSQPCMYFYIKRCVGPCLGNVLQKDYAQMIAEVVELLKGRIADAISKMRSEMKGASEKLEFERARALRDRIKSLSRIADEQAVVAVDLSDRDVVAVSRKGGYCCAVVFKVRSGRLVDRDVFYPRETQGADDSDVIESVLGQYYAAAAYIPPEILVQPAVKKPKEIAAPLSTGKEARARIMVPVRGGRRALVKMAADNARLLLDRKMLSQSDEQTQGALIDLRKKLNIDVLPVRIEAFDISNMQGAEIVGSMVSFVGGSPKKSDYRKFKVSTASGQDDVGSIYEIVSRRYGGSLGRQLPNPDLILVDGGVGQVNAAKRALQESGVGGIPVIGLAKREEAIYFPGEKTPLKLSKASKALHLLQRVRDEAHRFAITFHRARRRENFVRKGRPLLR